MACPSPDTLVGFFEGRLALAEDLERHLDGCAECRAAFVELGRSLSPASVLPGGPPASGARTEPSLGGIEPAAMPRVGQLLAGRYRIEQFIARGGMGAVYRARDLQLGSALAIKLLRAELADDPDALRRFKREVTLARAITHPNVCRIHDLGLTEPDPTGAQLAFLTMELLEGPTLAQRLLERGPMSPAEALPLVVQLVEGLAAAHAVRVIHRDFKTLNVMLVSPPGSPTRVVVTDFGLAHAMGGAGLPSTTSGTIAGTPASMAPEQLVGDAVTPRTDVYALGVVLFEMVTGVGPFRGRPLDMAARSKPPSAVALVAGLDPRWDRVISECLAADPAHRPAGVREVLAALEDRPLARRVPLATWRWRRALLAAGLATGALLGGVAWQHHERRSPGNPPAAAGGPDAGPPRSPGPPVALTDPQRWAQEHHRLGLAHLWRREGRKAAQELTAALELAPHDPLIQSALSQAQLMLGQRTLAIAGAGFARAQVPAGSEEVRLLVEARAQEARGAPGAAAASYARLFARAPGDLQLGVSLASTQAASGQHEAAHRTLETLGTLAGASETDALGVALCALNIERWHRTRGRYRSGLGLLRYGDLSAQRLQARAAALVTRARAAAAPVWLAEALHVLGDAQVLLRRGQEATAAFAEAERLFTAAADPAGVADVWLSRSLYLREPQRGRLLQKALASYEQLGHPPAMARVQEELGWEHLRAGQLDQAARAFKSSRQEGSLAEVELRRGLLDAAEQRWRAALEVPGQPPELRARHQEGLARIAWIRGQGAEAKRRLGEAYTLRGCTLYPDADCLASYFLVGAHDDRGAVWSNLDRLRGYEDRPALAEPGQSSGLVQARGTLALAELKLDLPAYDPASADPELLAQVARGLTRVGALLDGEDDFQTRLELDVVAARLLARRGRLDQAEERLQTALGRARRQGHLGLELAVELAQGEILAGSQPARAQSPLQLLQARATRHGFLRLAGRASAALRLASPAPQQVSEPPPVSGSGGQTRP